MGRGEEGQAWSAFLEEIPMHMDVVKVWYEMTAQRSQWKAIKWTIQCQIVLWMAAKSFLTLFQLFICLAKKTLVLWNAAIATTSIACQTANNMHIFESLSFLCILIIYLAHFLCCVFKVTYLFLWRFWGGERGKEI